MFTLLVAGCDLQPKIMSLPDSVGEFISARYPALLADPETQPEIYNSAATDYGVYASPDLYGTATTDDYVVYASVDDYIIPPQVDDTMYGAAPGGNASPTIDTGGPIADSEIIMNAASDDFINVPMYGSATTVQGTTEITVARGDTLYSLAKKYNVKSDELAQMNDLSAPYTLRVGQKLRVPVLHENIITQPIVVPARAVVLGSPTQTRVQLKTIRVAPGDTLYSLSRKYSIPVNDLAVMNDITAPFTLSVGQEVKVPNLESATVVARSSSGAIEPVKTVSNTSAPNKTQSTPTTSKAPVSTKTPVATTAPVATSTAPKQKISSDPSKKLPKINARTSSKFSWPVRGTILSHYGAKTGGLFNDGINISAARGTTVKAAENGVVAYAGNEVKGMGNLIIIQHSDGWMTVYAHMDAMVVRRGARVAVGQKIGTVGATGKVSSPQLHFEIRKGTKAYNPSSYLKK